ncbi:PQQ-dependent dehydrogenase, methanol/ethanol family [Caldimonas brevitalea]|uniref:Alcohol dehydrogenase n=1 Tax=Caldimonas brevitalea TaxID=413882 RepID=A0A0G3BLB6_9BURK|nr:PQQ-dependent dehydrogenase, methanol/ethanol family [Caldimonas brevitalea]AKJ30259.1 alcohol dehydrogenase [Caldimonas brevitalea]
MNIATLSRTAAAALCAALALLPGAHAAPAAGRVDAARIASSERDGANWLSHGRTYAEQRYSPLQSVHDRNVDRLGLAWWIDLDNDRGLEATPIVVDGVLYATLAWSRVIAVDARSGKTLWQYDPGVHKAKGRHACCDSVNRGVAVWKGLVYVGTLDGRLIALDAASGKPVWSTQTTDNSKPYTITGAPRVVAGKVIIGNGGAELGVRGYFSAYDARDGKLLWRVYTVPGNPAEPQESPELQKALATWNGEWWKYGGGGTVWNAMAYDPELKLLYVGTGNGSPWNREIRSPGGGDNLYLSSILAIDPDTGRLVWHYQTTPGDSWDYTATQDLVLADLMLDGVRRKVIMQAPKNGFFYVLDRATGELLSAEKFGKVTWAERVDKATGRPVETAKTRYTQEPSVQWPGPFGAHNWQPMSFSPKTGLVYIPYQELPFVYINGKRDFRYRNGAWNVGAGEEQFTAFPREVASGALIAWDPVRQRAAWKAPYAFHWNGGTMATAGNLVFQGTADGRFVAYAADDGRKLWEFGAQTGVMAGPVSYAVGGEQYVAVMAGWGGSAALIGGEATVATGVRNVSRLLVFKLGGKAVLPPLPPRPDQVARMPQPVTASAETVARGSRLYHTTCAMCHGVGAVSGGVIPDLRRSSDATRAAFPEIVLKGALQARGMPAFDDLLDADGLAAIKAYVMAREYEDHRRSAAPAAAASAPATAATPAPAAKH